MNSKKPLIFILSAPFSGSTLLYRLIMSDKNVSTLIGRSIWVGEPTWILIDNKEKTGIYDQRCLTEPQDYPTTINWDECINTIEKNLDQKNLSMH